jgi:nucleoside-diphosphate-sugar epimerase
MKILLTGATGFLGQNLKPVLSEDYEVQGIQSSFWDLRCQRTCYQALDQFKPDVIVHAAGSVGGILANKENPGKFMYENLIMGANLIEAARTEGVKKFILLGTVCAYPKHTPVPFKEEELWNGYPEETNAPYGIAKKTLMRLVEAYHEQYNFNGVNLVPVNMYGPHDHFNLTSSHVIPALILKVHQARKNGDTEVILWGSGQASREFLYAPDCAKAIKLAIEKDVSPEPINIGTGKEIKICELIETIADIMGFDGDIIYDTTKPDGQPRRCLDTSRAKDRLGFEAKTNLRDGLVKTIEWFNDSD